MDMVTLDWETYYSKDYSLSKMTTEAYIRDPRFADILVGFKINDEPTYHVDTRDGIAKHLRSLKLENKAVLCHHTAFDGAILHWRYGIVAAQYFDTMSMARPVTGNTCGVSLAALAKKFTMGEKGKEVLNALGKRRADFTPAEIAAYGGYCENDVQLTYTLFQILRQFSTPQEMYIIDMMLRMFIDPVFELDSEKLGQHLVEVRAKKEALLERVAAFCGKDGLMSNDKLADILRRLGVDPPMKLSVAKTNNAKTNPTGEPVMTYAFGKTDEGFKALLEHEDPFVQAVVSARMGVKSTLEETRTEAFMGIADRGPLPVYYHYYGAHTGRASGGDKVNLQNLPRGGTLRYAMRAPLGHSVVAGDSAQIEARVVAWWAGQQDLVDAFARGADIYSEFATDVFGYPVDRKREEVHPETGKKYFPQFDEGFVGKTSILGLGFGMGPDKFLLQLKKGKIKGGLEFAQKVVNLYRTKYARIKQLWEDCHDALKAVVNGYDAYIGVGIQLLWDQEGIHLPNGMVIRYPELRKNAKGEYEYKTKRGWVKLYGAKVVENVVQALARIIVFNQMAMIDQKLRRLDRTDGRYRICGSTHDEVLCVCPTHFRKQLLADMLGIMKVVPRWAAGLPITCEAASGDNYGECK